MPNTGTGPRERGRPRAGHNPLLSYANDASLSPTMRALADVCVRRGITLTMLVRLTGRDMKSLTRSLEAPSPRAETIKAFVRALGYPVRVGSALCEDFQADEAEEEIIAAIIETLNRFRFIEAKSEVPFTAFNEVIALSEQDGVALAARLVLAEHGFPAALQRRDVDPRLDILAQVLPSLKDALPDIEGRLEFSELEDELTALDGIFNRMRVSVLDRARLVDILEQYAGEHYVAEKKIKLTSSRRQARAAISDRRKWLPRRIFISSLP